MPDQLHLKLELVINYELIRDDEPEKGPYRAKTTGYRHGVYVGEDEAEVLIYHWHPGGHSHYDRPHLHIGGAMLRSDSVFSAKAHLPTGRITAEAVIRLCIRELGVPPQRDDWREVLNTSEGRHKKHRSWNDTPPPTRAT